MSDSQRLSLELFTKVQDDLEKRQYIILAELKKVSEEFRYYKIYPHLSMLAELYKILRDVLNRLSDLREQFPKRVGKIDWVNQTIEHEVIFVDGTDLSAVENLINWALPNIKKVIEEGVAIHEYVEKELSVEHVGILPNYRDEGYLFVPDNEAKKLNLFRFKTSIFQSSEAPYRSLRTRYLRSLNQSGAQLAPGSIKLQLIKEEKDLPNPATYSVQTNLIFPFEEAIMPVAKRKLMQAISK
jgi:hypothetical protein